MSFYLKLKYLSSPSKFHFAFSAERCLADFYIAYTVAQSPRSFYWRPLASDIQYRGQVFGINKIKGLMKEITGHTVLIENFTNRTNFIKRMPMIKISWVEHGVGPNRLLGRTSVQFRFSRKWIKSFGSY